VLRTKVTEDYGCEAPVVSAGMAFHSLPPLVVSVSNAGGIGTLGVGLTPPEGLREMIRTVKTGTSRPFGVDFIMDFATDEHIEVCAEEEVPVVVFFWSQPGAYVERLQRGGTKVWVQVGSVREARQAADGGADLIIAQGSEAGGHNKGRAATFTLVPAVVDAMGAIPVLAAGGIADGRGLAAALALGAEGVWVGTRFLASQEAYAHDEYKRRVVSAAETDTELTTLFGPEWPGQRTRSIRNRVVEEWAGREAEVPPEGYPEERIGTTVLGGQEVPMPKFSVLLPTPETEGDFEEMCLLAGESAGLVNALRPAAEIVDQMVSEAEESMARRLPAMVNRQEASTQHAR
jgi:NAD(P)H-dependent flavin oxidoreductase YrpB (nitropropane dioxygenase family)